MSETVKLIIEIDEVTTAIGLWMVAAFITFVIVFLFAFTVNSKWISDEDVDAFYVSLIVVVVIFEFILSIIFVTFKNNPEAYGYTRIEQEVETEVEQ
ncbi:MAG: hypothetical protein J6Y02_12795 [Pseudobutyrivibrio sp.]|nr:hypothetical protein [Pseudobutyrivibrio sp.]